MQHGERALAWYGGVTMAALTEIWLQQGDERRPVTISYRSRNVFRSAEDHDNVQPLRGRPVYAVLELGFVSGGRAKRVELEPPGKVRFNANQKRAETLAFLENAGFLAGPPAKVDPPRWGPEEEEHLGRLAE